MKEVPRALFEVPRGIPRVSWLLGSRIQPPSGDASSMYHQWLSDAAVAASGARLFSSFVFDQPVGEWLMWETVAGLKLGAAVQQGAARRDPSGWRHGSL